jgi:hypothetical protein
MLSADLNHFRHLAEGDAMGDDRSWIDPAFLNGPVQGF